MKLWWNYPLMTCLKWMVDHLRYDIKSHVLVIGPFAFAVIWRKKKEDNHEQD